MASRTISVLLTASVSNYLANLERARRSTDETAEAARRAAQRLEAQRTVLNSVGTGMATVGAAAAVAVGAVVKTTAEFNAKMAQLKTVSHASKTEMDGLRAAALSAGTAFGYTASQVADAQIELAKAGISAKQQLGGALQGALALAAAGQLEVGKATEIAVTAMTDFKLKAGDLPHVADLLAAGADKSTASVESIGMALQQSGLVAAQFGLSVEDTVGTLTAFAQAGLQGSDAGTSLKTMLLSLAKPSEQAANTLAAYNIHAYDAQGAFVGVTNLAEQLKNGLGKLSAEQRNAALATIFGTDAIRSAGVLYDLGGKKLQGFIDANNEAGFASAQAAGKLDSLTGDLQKLSAVIQGDMIKAGSGLEGSLRGMAQEATGVLTAFGNLPGPIQSTAVVATGLVAGVGLLGGAFLLAVPKIAEFRLALQTMEISGRRALGLFGKGSGILIGLSSLASGFANMSTSGVATADQINLAAGSIQKNFGNLDSVFQRSDSWATGINNIGDAFRNSFGNNGQNASQGSKLIDGLTFGLTHLSDTYKQNEGQFAAIGEQLKGLSQQDYSAAASSFSNFVQKMGGGNEVAKEALQAFPAYREQLVSMLSASGQAATEQNILAAASGTGGVASKLREAQSAAASNNAALQEMKGAAVDANGSIDELSKTISGFGSVALDARSANRAFQQAVDDATAAAKKNGRSLDVSTEAGRANQAALDNVASSAIAAAAAFAKTPGGIGKAEDAMKSGRAAFLRAATAMGLSSDEAKTLANKLGLIPKNVRTTINQQGASAVISAADQIKGKLNDLTNGVYTVNVRIAQSGSVNNVVPTGIRADQRKAAGGAIYGAGTKGVDSVPVLLAPGEHVLTAKEVDRMGGQGAVYAFRAGLTGYAGGGAIGDSKSDAAKASKEAAQYKKQLAIDNASLRKQQHEVDVAQKAYDNIDGTKKNQARKKAAKARLEREQKDVETAQKRVDTIQKKLDDAKSRADDANKDVGELRNAREDFVSAERRGGSDPLGYVDQLRAMSRDENYSPARRDAFKNAANDYEKTITDLNKKSGENSKALEESTKKLDDNKQSLDNANQQLDSLKATAAQVASSISGSISGKYAATSAVTAATGDRQVSTGTIIRNGIKYNATSTIAGDAGGATTVGSLSDYYAHSANDTGVFAAQLQQLANRNIDRALLAEIAGYGPQQGGAIARALLSASDTQFKAINNNYAATLVNSDRAGGYVSDYTYGGAISSAQAAAAAATATYNAQQAVVAAQQSAADQITAALTGDGDSLKNVIGEAFGLSGYASGTDNATAGLHLVGEEGPELLRFRGGESVMTASKTKNWIRGNRYASGRSAVSGNPVVVRMPDTITVADASGFTATMRVVARQEIATDQAEGVLLEWGGAA